MTEEAETLVVVPRPIATVFKGLAKGTLPRGSSMQTIPRGSKYPVFEASASKIQTFHGIWDQRPLKSLVLGPSWLLWALKYLHRTNFELGMELNFAKSPRFASLACSTLLYTYTLRETSQPQPRGSKYPIFNDSGPKYN